LTNGSDAGELEKKQHRWEAEVLAIVSALLLVLASLGSSSSRRVVDVRALPNDNRVAAGALRRRVLTLHLEARLAMWHPDGDDAPGALVPAFAEEGRAPQIPGPLIRVPAGTDIVVSVRNVLPRDTLVVRGLNDRTGASAAAAPVVVRLAPGERRLLRFRLEVPGTYYYWGTTTGRDVNFRTGEDAQLTGAIVVDSSSRPPRDRILVIGMWTDTVARAYVARQRILAVVNGRSWPHTERLVYDVGDSVRWRIINASGDNHPMHLHGTYFRVESRGDGRGDTTFRAEVAEQAVTAAMSPGTTMRIAWVPQRAGNWLFHCHIPEHFGQRGSLGLPPPVHPAGASHESMSDMNGLVMGIDVRPVRGHVTPPPVADVSRRPLRLLIRANAGGSVEMPFYEFSLQDGLTPPPRDSGLHVGPPLVLMQEEPVRITVVNTTTEATSVHWHGIELESYYDGVPGVSGSGHHLAPSIAPGDSFVVRFTPPRAGTFIYHTHVEEERQEPAGLAGPLIVLARGARWDPSTDHAVLITSPWSFEEGRTSVLVNGSTAPPPIVMRAGVMQRLRIINMTTRRPALKLDLRRDSALVAWTPLAKDGADLPEPRRIQRAVSAPISIGETLDFTITPETPGDLHLDVVLGGGTAFHPVLASLPIRVVGDRKLR
jgi:FtsP/CotA-like multicopper oxidase with cupredoxin domain